MLYLLEADFSPQSYDNSLRHLVFMGVFFVVLIVVAILWLRRS